MRLRIGSALALDGKRRTVVGIVENRRMLSDDFALVTPGSAARQYVTVLLEADAESVRSFFESVGDRSALTSAERRPIQRAADQLATFSVATVLLLLAALVAAAGFAVIAQRRLRQLGMLAAVGATQTHLRFVLLANGLIVGTIAALLGTIVGLALWFATAPTLESATDHRIERLSVPWGLIAAAVALAILAATAAAWWPGRAAARLPVVIALSGRPPKPLPARHAAIVAAVLVALGIVCLALSDRERPWLVVCGIIATILGCLLVGPLAIRMLSGLAGRLSIAPRLALRDLVRYQARSGAALAAVTLALGIATTVVVVASAEAAKRNAEPPNLSDRQIRVHLGPPEDREATPVDAVDRMEALDASVRRLAAQLTHATVVPLRKVVTPAARSVLVPGEETPVLRAVDLLRQEGPQFYLLTSKLFVATPEVLGYLRIDPETIDQRKDFLAYPRVEVDELVVAKPRRGGVTELSIDDVQQIETGRRLFGSFDFGFNEVVSYTPPTFITLAGVRRRGWKQIPSTWLVESSRPLASDQLAAAREIARDAGLHPRGETGEDLVRHLDRDRDSRGRCSRTRHPGDDGRPDPR